MASVLRKTEAGLEDNEFPGALRSARSVTGSTQPGAPWQYIPDRRGIARGAYGPPLTPTRRKLTAWDGADQPVHHPAARGRLWASALPAWGRPSVLCYP
jgi:hypothetical protein